ncbi:MAG: sodium:proton antiporter [Planctomycetales bacterium]|nr:sodium:proton antiporter [Planctomycetales bacterium]
MTHAQTYSPHVQRRLLLTIGAVIVGYAFASLMGWPQRATDLINHDTHGHVATSRDKPEPPPVWAVAPFVLLLGAIAVLPLLATTKHWWESNRNRFLVAASLGAVSLAFYALLHRHAIERHFLGHELVSPSSNGVSWLLVTTVFQNAVLGEYVPFIVLLFSLYTICGGIRISGDLPAHPLTNTTFIAIGGVLASLIGTTGAAMVLIRPLLETNSERKHVRHTVVFFIFVVCNCGGCLLPIGDPPLFLGYLEGVDFLWTLSLWKEWAFVNLSLLAIYYCWDQFWAYPCEAKRDIVADERRVRKLQFRGLWPNTLLLLGVVLAVAMLDPSKPIPGTQWHPWLWLREIVQLVLVGLSLWMGSQAVRRDNRFTYAAILEVAVLFLGIFVCMQPALQILDVRGAALGVDTPAKFYWFTGALSSVLDNAPTYLVFFKAAQAQQAEGPSQAGVAVEMLAAISLGAVFMGAMTYIGNGPNFMVKSIAEQSGVTMPSFFGYLLYSVFVLLPLLVLMQVLFL